MTWTINEMRGATDSQLLARIRELEAKSNRDWSDSQELSLLKSVARRRGLEVA